MSVAGQQDTEQHKWVNANCRYHLKRAPPWFTATISLTRGEPPTMRSKRDRVLGSLALPNHPNNGIPVTDLLRSSISNFSP